MGNYVCKHCGEEFQGYGMRRYCSKDSFAAYRNEHEPQKDKKPSDKRKSDRVDAYRLYKKGYGYEEIGMLLGRYAGTIKTWSDQDGWDVGRRKASERAKPSPVNTPQKRKEDRQEALRLRGEGYTCKEIAARVGRSTNTVKSWSYRYGWTVPEKGLDGIRAEAMRLYEECHRIGEIATVLKQTRHTIRVWVQRYGGKAKCTEEKLRQEQNTAWGKDDRLETLRLREEGYTYKEIGQILDRSPNTLHMWVYRHKLNPERTYTKPPQKRRRSAVYSMEQWRARLADKPVVNEGQIERKRVYLVCGATRIGQGIDGLVTIIEHRLNRDPYSGDRYIFCGERYKRLKSIEWNGGGFLVGNKCMQQGTFLWPRNEKEGVREIGLEEYTQFMEYEA